MGNEQNKKNNDVQIQLNHSKIHSIKVINDIKKRYMQAIFGIEQADYQGWKQNLINSKSNTDYLLWPLQHSFSSKALCGTTGSVKVSYDNYPYLLIEQIQNRRAKKKRFDQTELWQLLYCLIQAQKQMRNGTNSRIGDIRPHNVFLNQQGNIKVANLLSWPKQTTNYQKFLQNQITYLAPQDMKFVQSSSIDNQSNKLSQIFSIGLTILSAANLVDYKKLYNTKSFKIIHEWRINDVYSDIFKATIASLIEVNLEQRINQYELQPWIVKYKTQILSRQDFIINDPPSKIINQITFIRKIYQSNGIFLPVQQIKNQRQYQQNQRQYQEIVHPALHGSDNKRFMASSNVNSFPFQGQRRLVEQKRLPAVSIIPGTTAVESIYTPSDKFASNFMIPGVNVNNIGFESYKNNNINNFPLHGTFTNSTYIPRTNLEYKSSPVTQHLKNISQKQMQSTDRGLFVQNNHNDNQPQIQDQR